MENRHRIRSTPFCSYSQPNQLRNIALIGMYTGLNINPKGRWELMGETFSRGAEMLEESISPETLAAIFEQKLHRTGIQAKVRVKKHITHHEIWVIHKEDSSLEEDLRTSSAFCTLEKEYPELRLSLFMTTEGDYQQIDIQ